MRILTLIFITTTLSAQQPNIILFLTDDGRYDTNNSYFPNIKRIADEGVVFANAFTVYPLCTPSRAIIQSGLYPHTSNNMYNYNDAAGSIVDTTDFILGETLQAAGYYTIFVGKAFNDWKKPLTGYDYWAGSTAGNAYEDPSFNINGQNQNITGDFSKIIYDLAIAALNNAPNKPIFLMVCDKAPHSPLKNTTAYNNENFPTPSNFVKFESNFPSYLYPENEYLESVTKLEKKIEKFYETLAYTDTGIGRIITWLENENALNNTAIIYTSDHGFMLGEHKLNGKGLPYDEVLRIPLFIRYPPVFVDTILTEQIATNLDILPTIFGLAGASYSGGLHGITLQSLYDCSCTRDAFMFEFQVDAIPGIPSFRGVRTREYLFTNHYCTGTVYELFDLTIDQLQNTNVAYDIEYSLVRDVLQDALDEVRINLEDFTTGYTLPCSLE